MATARLRADAGRHGDPLAVAHDVVARAAAANRPLSLHERATIRQHVREYESTAGESLLEACDRIVARQRGDLIEAGDRQALRQLLDIADALAA